MKKSITLLLLLLTTLSIGAQNLPMDPKIRHGKLDNGLTYYIQHNNYPEKRADFYLAQKVGSMQEEDDQAGLAHFLEHMAFAGTKNFPKKLVQNLEQYGVKFGESINAYTSFDETVYFLSSIPTQNETLVDTCLLILHDWCGFIALRNDDIDKERKVIKEEWRTRTGSYSRIWDKQLPVIYEGSKYADRMPIGKMDVVDNFEYDVLKDYYHKWYRPDLQAIIVVGDVDVDHVENHLKTIFKDIPKPVSPAERIYYPVLDNRDPIISIATDKEATDTQLALYIKHDIVPANSKNTQDWLVNYHIQRLVNGMLSNRLTEIAQRSDAPFNYAYSNYGNFFVSKTKDALSSGAGVKEGKVKEALTVLIQEHLRAKQHGFTSTEIERAKANLLKSYENLYNNRNKQYNGEVVQTILHNHLIDGPITGVEYEYEMLKRLVPTLEDKVFNDAISRMIKEDNIILTISGPEKDGLIYPTESELINLMYNLSRESVEPYIDNVSNEPLIDKLPPVGKVVNTKKGDKFDETIWTLSNGMKIVLKNTKFQEDGIVMSANSYGGTSIFPDNEKLEIDFVNSVHGIGGVGSFSTIDLQKVLSGKTGHVNPWISSYKQGMRGFSSIKDVETMLQLTHLYFTAPRKDIESYNAFIAKRKSYMLNEKSNPSYIFGDSINKTLYGDQIRAKKIEIEDLDRLNYDRMISMYKECFANPGSFTFTFVGTVDEEVLKPLVEKYLASLPSGNKGAKYNDVDLEIRKGHIKNHFTQKMETPKATSFTMYTATIDRTIETLFPKEILSNILDLVFYRTMRGDEGGTYGVNSNLQIERIPNGETKLQIYYTTDPKRIDEMNAIVHKELKEIADNGPRIDEFDKAKENLIKKRTEWNEMNGFWTTVLDIAHFEGEDENSDYINRIKAVKISEVQSLLKEIISQDNVIEVVMTPQD